MPRLVVALVGFAVLLLGFAQRSGTLTVLGGVVLAAGVLWFVFVGNDTNLAQRTKDRP